MDSPSGSICVNNKNLDGLPSYEDVQMADSEAELTAVESYVSLSSRYDSSSSFSSSSFDHYSLSENSDSPRVGGVYPLTPYESPLTDYASRQTSHGSRRSAAAATAAAASARYTCRAKLLENLARDEKHIKKEMAAKRVLMKKSVQDRLKARIRTALRRLDELRSRAQAGRRSGWVERACQFVAMGNTYEHLTFWEVQRLKKRLRHQSDQLWRAVEARLDAELEDRLRVSVQEYGEALYPHLPLERRASRVKLARAIHGGADWLI